MTQYINSPSKIVLFAQLTLDTHNDIDNEINGKNDVFEKVIVIVINNTGNDLSSAASSSSCQTLGPELCQDQPEKLIRTFE